MSDTSVAQNPTAETVYATDSVMAGPPVSLDDYQDISGEFVPSQAPVEKELETESEAEPESEPEASEVQEHFERVSSSLLLGGIMLVSAIAFLGIFSGKVDIQHPYGGRDYF